MQPLVHAAINGKDAIFLADSGAFFSTLTAAGAHALNLNLEHVNHNFALRGVGGKAQVWMTTVQTFTMLGAGAHRPGPRPRAR
jgi:predicted aspartyl protease